MLKSHSDFKIDVQTEDIEFNTQISLSRSHSRIMDFFNTFRKKKKNTYRIGSGKQRIFKGGLSYHAFLTDMTGW